MTVLLRNMKVERLWQYGNFRKYRINKAVTQQNFHIFRADTWEEKLIVHKFAKHLRSGNLLNFISLCRYLEKLRN